MAEPDVYTNYMIDQFMDQKKNTDIENYFDSKELEAFNAKVKNDNNYALDYFGIPVRRKEQGKKKPNGWILKDGHVYHYLVNRSLIGISDNDTIRDQTIDLIKQKYPKVFTTNTATHRILMALYGDKYE